MKIYTAFEQLFGQISLSCSAELIARDLLKASDSTSSGQEARFAFDFWIFLVYIECSEQLQPCALQLPEQENVRQLPVLLPSSLFHRFRKVDEHQGNKERKHEHFSSYSGPIFAWLIGTGRKETTIFPKSLP